ncbi:hypothetical protein FPV67DRAFT_1473963 [Lyophyllum atratum]|nr:hypothetical protein FPV67DRAFT_1473963 [Lyophyllum atratum]
MPRKPFQELAEKLYYSVKKSLGEDDLAGSDKALWPASLAVDSLTVLADPLISIADERDDIGTCLCSSSTPASSSSSEASSEDPERSDETSTQSFHLDPPQFTKGEKRLISDASRAMAASSRHYVVGTYIDGCTVALWYFDRTCVIRTVSFDFVECPQNLALVVYALNYSRCRYGSDPFLVVPANSTPLGRMGLKELDEAEMVFPPLYNAGMRFRFEGKLIHEACPCPSRLMGRGTIVYAVSEIRADNGPGAQHLALKVSWPAAWRLSEGAYLIHLSERLPGWRDHLPSVVYHHVYCARDLGLPRAELLYCGVPRESDRYLSVLAMPVYGHLWEVDDVREFKSAFMQCVACHHAAYDIAGVLHGDISGTNLMFRRTPSKAVYGVLNDWDLAGLVDPHGVMDSEGVRTGTVPFMAMELLQRNPPPHRYEHDLESFFYVLVWAAVHFDIRNHVCIGPRPLAYAWSRGDVGAKRDFLLEDGCMGAWYEEVREEFRDLWCEWIVPLRDVFAYQAMGGEVRFEDVMSILQR